MKECESLLDHPPTKSYITFFYVLVYFWDIARDLCVELSQSYFEDNTNTLFG